MAYDDLASFSEGQSRQSFGAAPMVQQIADPYAPARMQNINRLQGFLDKPESSPGYAFAQQQMEDKLRKQAAAGGMLGSGNRLADLVKYSQGLQTQDYFNHGNFLAQLAMQGSSPGAAGLGFSNMFGRGQDQASIGAASRQLGQQPRNALNGFNPNVNAFGQPFGQGGPQAFNPSGQGAGGFNGGTGLPSGGMTQYPGYSGFQGNSQPMNNGGFGFIQNDQTGAATMFGNGGWGSMGTGYIPESYTGGQDFGGGNQFAGGQDFGNQFGGYEDFSGFGEE